MTYDHINFDDIADDVMNSVALEGLLQVDSSDFAEAREYIIPAVRAVFIHVYEEEEDEGDASDTAVCFAYDLVEHKVEGGKLRKKAVEYIRQQDWVNALEAWRNNV